MSRWWDATHVRGKLVRIRKGRKKYLIDVVIVREKETSKNKQTKTCAKEDVPKLEH